MYSRQWEELSKNTYNNWLREICMAALAGEHILAETRLKVKQ